jgi:hypothetical protein
MKKGLLFLFLCLIPLIGFGQSTFVRGVKIGTTNTATVIDSISKFGSNFRMYNGATRITESDVVHDTITALKAAATNLEDYVTSRLSSYGGSGGSVGMYELRGIVGTTTGFPVNGDSLVINDSLIAHPHITVYREGKMQWMNVSNANAPDGYKFTATTGTITFKPILATGEQVIIHAFDPVIWHDLVPTGGTGGGGASGESALLTNLIAYYSLDESSGSTVVDATGTQNGTAKNVTVNQSTASLGRSHYFNGTTSVTEIPYNASQAITGTVASIACRVNLSTLPSTLTHASYLVRGGHSGSPYEAIYLTIGTDNKVAFHVKNTTSDDYAVISTTVLTTGT